MRELRNSKKAPGAKHIYTAGEKEYYTEKGTKKVGIPVNRSVQEDIKIIQKELGLEKYKFSF